MDLLGLNPERCASRVERGRKDPEFVPIPIAENLGIEEVAAVEARAAEHPEFAITVSQRRLYKHGGSAAHALGYLSEATPEQIKNAGNVYGVGDWIGQKGIESAYERLLAGANGERRVIVDSHGREVAEEARLEASPGQNLFLTLDLEAAGHRRGVLPDKVGSVVALDPRDGRDPHAGLLALLRSELVHAARDVRGVERPAREPRPSAAEPGDPEHVFARARSSSPSSPTARWRADSWTRSPQSSARDTPTFYGREFHCHKKGGHGWVNLRDAIKMSCDVYFYNLGQKLGIDRINEILTSFGFGAADRRRPLRSRSRASCRRRSGRASQRGARWYPSETISVVDRTGARCS